MRLFFGAALPDPTKSQIENIQNSFRNSIPGARWEGRDKLHVTLQFLGDFNDKKVEDLFSSVSKALELGDAGASPTEIVGAQYFPNIHIRRGIWLDASDDGSLKSIAGIIKGATSTFGVVAEAREFVPHITIARIRNREYWRSGDGEVRDRFPDLQNILVKSKLTVDQFFPTGVALFESTLNPGGSSYRILHEFPLQHGRNVA